MDTLLWILALFGLWQLANTLWRWLLSFRFVPPQVSLLFLVKNNQDSVEGLFRQLALDCYFMGHYAVPGQVLVVDLGSQDQTLAIMRRLAGEITFLHLRTIADNEVGEVLEEFRQGVLVVDLRVLSARKALQSARHFLAKMAPSTVQGQTAHQLDA